MSNIKKPIGYQIHYSGATNYYGGSVDQHQKILSEVGLHVYDVVLLAYICLDCDSRLDYITEFTKLVYGVNPYAKIARPQHHTASLIYFSVKGHIREKLGVDSNVGQLPKFKLNNYAFGTNKQTMAAFIVAV